MHFNHWLFRLPFLRDCEAITLPWGIYFRGEPDLATIKHEMVHVEQRERLGAARFYIDYACQFLRGLAQGKSVDEAYRAISYEREAYLASSL